VAFITDHVIVRQGERSSGWHRSRSVVDTLSDTKSISMLPRRGDGMKRVLRKMVDVIGSFDSLNQVVLQLLPNPDDRGPMRIRYDVPLGSFAQDSAQLHFVPTEAQPFDGNWAKSSLVLA
jgi:hypothetical protein